MNVMNVGSGGVERSAERVVEKHFPPVESAATANVLRLAGLYGPGRLLRRVDALKSGSPISGNPDGWLNLIRGKSSGVWSPTRR